MSARDTRRFVADLLRGRRPRSFRADDADAAQLRAAITLRSAQPGSAAPREEFVDSLHQRLATELSGQQKRPEVRLFPSRSGVKGSRREVVQTGLIAAAAAAVGAVVDHSVTSPGPAKPGGVQAAQTLVPNTGVWRTVSTSADLAEGRVQSFDLGTVVGFVARTGGQLQAVSGICTHLGCRLALDASARQLDCPCHATSFALNGQLLRYQLATPPRPLPHFEVREVDGAVQIFAPV